MYTVIYTGPSEKYVVDYCFPTKAVALSWANDLMCDRRVDYVQNKHFNPKKIAIVPENAYDDEKGRNTIIGWKLFSVQKDKADGVLESAVVKYLTKYEVD